MQHRSCTHRCHAYHSHQSLCFRSQGSAAERYSASLERDHPPLLMKGDLGRSFAPAPKFQGKSN